jgi:hypothetical protein
MLKRRRTLFQKHVKRILAKKSAVDIFHATPKRIKKLSCFKSPVKNLKHTMENVKYLLLN